MINALAPTILAAVLPGQVFLRGGSEALDTPVANVSASGVEVGEGDSARLLHWGEVKRIEGESADEASRFSGVSDSIWRGGARLARDDYTGAAPLFRDALDSLDESFGYSRLIAASGLARCAVLEGDLGIAARSWTEVLAISRQIWGQIEGEGAFLLHFDTQTGLSQQIAPIWLGNGSTRLFLDEGAPSTVAAAGDDVVLTLDRLYRAAAAFESERDAGIAPDEGVPPPPDSQADLPGVELVWLSVSSRAGNRVQREAARARMTELVEDAPGDWREAWLRTALGRSLLRERLEDERDAGLIHLLHVPSRFASTQPYLAGVALAEIALEMESKGRAAEARQVRSVLAAMYPGHPAVRWLDEQRRGAQRAAPPPTEQGDA